MAASNDPLSGRKPQTGQDFADIATDRAEGASIDPADVARFSAQAAEWWDARGPFAPLHRFNPARLAFIRDRVAERFHRDPARREAFAGLSLIDIGCGGGLIAEPMRRLGFTVTAIDASSENIGTARTHADEQGLDIAYRAATVEQIEAEGAGPFDVVLVLEIIEHVADPESFLRACSRRVAPGGIMIVASLNRTLKSLALGKIAAEYILRWVPAGTHDWRQFPRPDEIRRMLSAEPLTVTGPSGLVYNPLTDRWGESADADVNFMMVATRD
ncbi:bifunctional 2-polyprenyl-6-hydroxyphenol methylase/3-demethylubiquinol 3-O-methyltransferase UbiG [Brevundimonas sp. AJA228-03]|uniref:bifunctional 2-polyprenyl-6-hydroxyphenol methylase/3-demethylubiquinol 3-O-methyltransferase UbiG n=1 Tax=Brevundimonas sp. AJA228-03 TaxID=2752515 RepID=UPI001AE0E513|nr:bifunctional 2-polyprenyl-6-hydroxyphenol methylase/3-demethylubiquinol 3-O-methyltransferase UbiG [Brevundimonas sp. AJA228-03]QTN20125.1 bifunctional 2-polyprenyl-6-hydroxyphenol methylase/3-demethylubiquinol 3-O-methyltransferase UbiG [Brevundimonas sp. AJA228-03]